MKLTLSIMDRGGPFSNCSADVLKSGIKLFLSEYLIILLKYSVFSINVFFCVS